MDATLKAKWVEALRSGEYRQGRIYFNRGDKFCCLGVLCKVAGQPLEIGPAHDNWAFVEERIQESAVAKLIDMNDNMGASFSQIADHIEAHL